MNKTELISCICRMNRYAGPDYLEDFSEDDLNEYLEHLTNLCLEEVVVVEPELQPCS